MRILILGTGVVGAMAAWRIAQAGHEVTILEQFELDHDRGSSYGDSRIVRRIYADPFYTALMARAYPLWDELQSQYEEELFSPVGGIFFGPIHHPDVLAAEAALQSSGVGYERLDAVECRRRFPAFHFRDEEMALYEPSMGYARASSCVRAAVKLATKLGAQFHFRTEVKSIESTANALQVETVLGERFEGDKLLICGGSWNGSLLAGLGVKVPLQVVRKTYVHLLPQRHAANFESGRFPVWIDALSLAYGFPRLGETPGVKIAFHGGGEVVSPDDVQRSVNKDEHLEFLNYTAERFPDLSSEIVFEKVCLYTNTPDEDFIIDRVPDVPNAFVIGGTSGHGFKFGPLFGEIALSLVTGGTVPYDFSRFSLSRFNNF